MTTQGPTNNQQQQATEEGSGTMLKPGIYKKCRLVEDSVKYGYSSKNTPEITVNVTIPELRRQATVVLYFSPEAAKFSMERLRSAGWEGKDIKNLKGCGSRDVDIEITYEMFEGKSRPRVQIMGGGTFETRNPASSVDEWAARVQALTGANVGGGGATDPDPDFG